MVLCSAPVAVNSGQLGADPRPGAGVYVKSAGGHLTYMAAPDLGPRSAAASSSCPGRWSG